MLDLHVSNPVAPSTRPRRLSLACVLTYAVGLLFLRTSTLPVSLHQQHVVPPGTVSTSPTWPGDPYSGTFQEYELTPAEKKLPDPNLGEEEL